MGQTSKYNLPYPNYNDYVKQTPQYIQELAESIETNLTNTDNAISNTEINFGEQLDTLQENLELKISLVKPVELIAVTDVAPTECTIGDKYYNTTDNKIYTAEDTNTWEETSVSPLQHTIYLDKSTQKIYYCDGTSFKNYGGTSGSSSGTKEVGYEDEELEGTEKILIEESDFDGVNAVELAEVVQTLNGDETDKVPSVKAVNESIETITNDNGTAIKFPDGTMICAMKRSLTGTCDTEWGNLYATDNLDLGNYPVNFISNPVISASVSGQYSCFIGPFKNLGNSSIGSVNLLRPSKLESESEWEVQITAIGRWK